MFDDRGFELKYYAYLDIFFVYICIHISYFFRANKSCLYAVIKKANILKKLLIRKSNYKYFYQFFTKNIISVIKSPPFGRKDVPLCIKNVQFLHKNWIRIYE